MKDNEKILFILNPVSGNKNHQNIETLIHQCIGNEYEYSIIRTEYKEHGRDICSEMMIDYSVIVAIGGDGTVNEIAGPLIGTNKHFGLIPTGSGNGFANFFKIPSDPKKALQTIISHKIKTVDAIKLNDKFSVNMSGLGFDAHIAHLFADRDKRGFLSYIFLVMKEFNKYKSSEYLIKYDNNEIHRNAFLISFANSTQFGNNAHIAPFAKTDDGFLDVCILRKFSFFSAIPIGIRLFNKTINKSKFYETFQTKKIEIINIVDTKVHIDGEPITFSGDIQIEIIPKSLNIIVP
ncbi:MAG: diacylglycerol kinase family protein [Bacteroidota bacterium]